MTKYEDLYNLSKRLMMVEEGKVSADGIFSISKVECLGACVNAPVIKVNDIFVEDITDKSLVLLINGLKQDKELDVIINVKKTLAMGL